MKKNKSFVGEINYENENSNYGILYVVVFITSGFLFDLLATHLNTPLEKIHFYLNLESMFIWANGILCLILIIPQVIKISNGDQYAQKKMGIYLLLLFFLSMLFFIFELSKVYLVKFCGFLPGDPIYNHIDDLRSYVSSLMFPSK